ncbi:DUF6409 family protein [Streptomyces sp. NBC_01304]|uniref:DUF6409 family protein n=1 Tax=Streptomyces sp. NBC_01304 TaxID=2903818 RepID=UPI002E1134D1|nr:DUF6409 family protein [Streptomyces sp. NBC_01304]
MTAVSAPKSLPVGTVVQVRISTGLRTRTGKAVILDESVGGGQGQYGVWFYPAGDAKAGYEGTVCLAFGKEIVRVHGSIEDMSERTLRHLDRGLRHFGPSHPVRMQASALRLRKRAARLASR